MSFNKASLFQGQPASQGFTYKDATPKYSVNLQLDETNLITISTALTYLAEHTPNSFLIEKLRMYLIKEWTKERRKQDRLHTMKDFQKEIKSARAHKKTCPSVQSVTESEKSNSMVGHSNLQG